MNLLTDKTSAAISRSMKSPAMNFDLGRLIRCASRLQQAANCEHRLPHSANTVGSRLLPLLSVVFCIAAFTTPGHAQPTITIAPTDARAAETWPGQTADTGSVRLTRTGSTASSLTVNMRLRGDAVLGADFTLAPAFVSTLTFAAGDSDIDLTLTPIDDLVTEPTKFVRVEIQNPTLSNAYLIGGSGRAEVTLADNDDPNTPPRARVSVEALDSTAAEGPNGVPRAGTFHFIRDVNTKIALMVTYEIGGSATPGEDYAALSGNVVIPAGVEFVDVVVVPVDDVELEGSEVITLTLLQASCPGMFPPPPDCYTIGTSASAALTLLDNEIPPPPPVVNLTATQDSTVYGLPAIANGSFTASATHGFIASYAVRMDGVVTFSGSPVYPNPPAPGTPFEFSFTITNLAAGPHSVQAVVTDDQGLSSSSLQTLVIYAIPIPFVPATYKLFAVDSEAAETNPGETPNPGKFLFVRQGTPGDLEIYFYTFTGTARQGVDYTVTYGATTYTTNGWTNMMTQEIIINPIDDPFQEGLETVILQLCFPILRCIEGNCAPVGTYCSDGATLSLLDNDTNPPPISVVRVVASDADAQEVSLLSPQPQNPGVFTLTRTTPTANDLTVNYSLSRPPTTASPIAVNGVDYQSLSGVAVIPAGAVSVELELKPIYDTSLEGNETATLTLLPGGPTATTTYLLDPSADNSASIVIRDYAPTNIPVVSITANAAQAIEENVYRRIGSFLVTRSGSLDSSLTVPYSIDGTASNGVDYAELPGSVTIPAGTPSAAILINPIVDGVTEPIETVGLTLQIPSLDVFPPPYLFSTAASLHSSAGLTIRDTALYPGHPFLTKRQRILMRRFPHRYVVVPLPITVFNDPTLPPPANTTTITWAVEASSDLRAWTEVGTTTDSEEFVDVTAGDASQRFYRFRTVPPIAP